LSVNKKALIAAVVIVIVGASAFAAFELIPKFSVGQTIDWANMHGVNYGADIFGGMWGQYGLVPNAIDDLPTLKSLGFNVIRLQLSWSAYVANPVGFVRALQDVVSSANVFGIDVVIANFQNEVDSNLTLSWGFPSFLTEPYGANYTAFWVAWWSNQVTNVNTGQNGWQEQTQWLQSIAKDLIGYPNVIGYDLLNEPSVYSTQEYSELAAYYNYVASGIRNVSQGAYLIFQPPGGTYGGFGNLCFPDCYEEIAPNLSFGHLVFSPHVYANTSEAVNQIDSYGELLSNSWNNKISGWIGEWAIASPVSSFNGSWTQVDQNSVYSLASAAATSKMGWAYYVWLCGRPSGVEPYSNSQNVFWKPMLDSSADCSPSPQTLPLSSAALIS
jgi:Cellulase (glycosyl hydrolase family 5)